VFTADLAAPAAEASIPATYLTMLLQLLSTILVMADFVKMIVIALGVAVLGLIALYLVAQIPRSRRE
jgi:hypothetical protein